MFQSRTFWFQLTKNTTEKYQSKIEHPIRDIRVVYIRFLYIRDIRVLYIRDKGFLYIRDIEFLYNSDKMFLISRIPRCQYCLNMPTEPKRPNSEPDVMMSS